MKETNTYLSYRGTGKLLRSAAAHRNDLLVRGRIKFPYGTSSKPIKVIASANIRVAQRRLSTGKGPPVSVYYMLDNMEIRLLPRYILFSGYPLKRGDVFNTQKWRRVTLKPDPLCV